jgi:hypothetical protein
MPTRRQKYQRACRVHAPGNASVGRSISECDRSVRWFTIIIMLHARIFWSMDEGRRWTARGLLELQRESAVAFGVKKNLRQLVAMPFETVFSKQICL